MEDHDGIQIYFAISCLQLEFWEFKNNILAREFLVHTREGLDLKNRFRGLSGWQATVFKRTTHTNHHFR